MHIIYFYTYFLPDLSYMFRCVIHHPQEELRILGENRQPFTRLLHEMSEKSIKYTIFCRLTTLFKM
jgi:hypothetical protein